jgi:hypothetical protein
MKKKWAAALAASLFLLRGGAAMAAEAPAAIAAPPASTAEQCELHVWPTENYLGWNSGLLIGFGVVGAVADSAAHAGKVRTVKDLMREYLGPEVQLAELNRVGILESLRLPPTYRIVIEEPTPWNEDLKRDPALKANRRLTGSQSPCYAELITTMVFYHKAMMYGSNLFTGFYYREFGDKPLAQKVATGMVKNPLEIFPAKTPDKVPAAQAELRNAFVLDYREWLQKKYSNAAAPRTGVAR